MVSNLFISYSIKKNRAMATSTISTRYPAAAFLNFTTGEIRIGQQSVHSGATYPISTLNVPVLVPGQQVAYTLADVEQHLATAPYFGTPGNTFYRVSLPDGTPLILLSQHSRTGEVPGKYLYKQPSLTLIYENLRSNDIVPFGFLPADLPDAGGNCPGVFKDDCLCAQQDVLAADYSRDYQLYNAERLLGSASARRIAAGQSEQTGLVTAWAQDGQRSLAAVNYTAVDSAVTGRGLKDLPRDGFRDDRSAGVGAPSSAYLTAPVRPAEWIETRASRTDYGELVNKRMYANSTAPSGMLNLTPVYASAECRQNAVDRLNRLNEAYVNARLNSEL